MFESISGYDDTSFTVTTAGGTERIPGARVTASTFHVLRIPPILGRSFAVEEELAGTRRVAMLSCSLWQASYGSDPNIVGKILRLNGEGYSIVGVLPPNFRFPANLQPQVFVPVILPSADEIAHMESVEVLKVIARLKPGTTLQTAQSNLAAILARVQREHPELYDADDPVRLKVISLQEKLVGNVRPALLLLIGAAAFVLLIASVNVANLFLVKAVAREQEIALRTALGASRGRIVNALLSESILISTFGGALGLGLAFGGLTVIRNFLPKTIPRADSIGIDGWVMCFTFGISVLSALVFALTPALRPSKGNLFEILKKGNQGSEISQLRIRGLLVVGEVSLAVMLLILSCLLVKSFIRLNQVDLGFNPKNVLTMGIALPQWKYLTSSQDEAFHGRTLRKLRQLPGVKTVASIGFGLPLGRPYVREFAANGLFTPSVNISGAVIVVSPDYFEAMSIPLLAGRSFTDGDATGAPQVAIITEELARRYWPSGDPIGKQIDPGFRQSPGWRTVVGVVGNVKQEAVQDGSPPTIYLPYLQAPSPEFSSFITFVVRSSSSPLNLAHAVRESIQSLDMDVPVSNVATMDQRVSEAISEPRFNAFLLSLFGMLALLLATIGIYAVLSYWVTLRTREIGIRIALGASRTEVMKSITGRGMLLAGIGLVLGLAGSAVLAEFLSSFLFAVSPTDSTAFLGVVVLVATVALVAAYIPARRAARVDPMIAVRYE